MTVYIFNTERNDNAPRSFIDSVDKLLMHAETAFPALLPALVSTTRADVTGEHKIHDIGHSDHIVIFASDRLSPLKRTLTELDHKYPTTPVLVHYAADARPQSHVKRRELPFELKTENLHPNFSFIDGAQQQGFQNRQILEFFQVDPQHLYTLEPLEIDASTILDIRFNLSGGQIGVYNRSPLQSEFDSSAPSFFQNTKTSNDKNITQLSPEELKFLDVLLSQRGRAMSPKDIIRKMYTPDITPPEEELKEIANSVMQAIKALGVEHADHYILHHSFNAFQINEHPDEPVPEYIANNLQASSVSEADAQYAAMIEHQALEFGYDAQLVEIREAGGIFQRIGINASIGEFLHINTAAEEVYWPEGKSIQKVTLMPEEARILEVLINFSEKGEQVTSETLLEEVFRDTALIDEQIIPYIIEKIRVKLEEDLGLGRGYIFEGPQYGYFIINPDNSILYPDDPTPPPRDDYDPEP